jgi:hypothetical protein
MPPYEPAVWNDGAIIQLGNNCYDYCWNHQSGVMDNKTQPGASQGQEPEPDDPYEGDNVVEMAQLDGLLEEQGEGQWRVALVIDPDEDDSDYHWYREDDGGGWSHKPGHDTVRNTDEAGAVIADPEAADRGDYTEWVGYYYVGPAFPDPDRATAAVQATTDTPEISALVFSGRKDPALTPDAGQQGEIAARLQGLTRASAIPEGGLSYSGCLVTAPGSSQLPVAVRAYNGVVEVTQAPGKVSLYQDQKGLEKYLLGLLKARGDWALIQRRIRKARRASPAALEAIGE